MNKGDCLMFVFDLNQHSEVLQAAAATLWQSLPLADSMTCNVSLLCYRCCRCTATTRFMLAIAWHHSEAVHTCEAGCIVMLTLPP